MSKIKNRNSVCPTCGKKRKNCSCGVKKINYKKFVLIALSILFILVFYFSIKGMQYLNDEKQEDVLVKPGGAHFTGPEEAYQSLINFISDRSSGTYMILLLKDRSKLNFSIAINHGSHKDETHKRTSEQLKKISWWFNRIKGDKLFLIEQAGLANNGEYTFKDVSNKAYYENILMSDFLIGIDDSRIRECDIRKNLFHEANGNLLNMLDYGEIAKKANYNIRHIVFELEPGDHNLPFHKLFPKIMSPGYNVGLESGYVSKEDLYESLLFEQSSVLFEEECVKYMDEDKYTFSITGAMHAPYICENVLFVASSPEELELMVQITNRHFVMRHLLNNMTHDMACPKYKKICSYLKELFGTKVPINYKNVY
jgi:hypothetical protein